MSATLADICRRDQQRLALALGLSEREARLEVQLLLGHVLQKPRSHLIAHGESPLEPPIAGPYEALLSRRLQGEPMAYILGRREFYGMELRLSPAVLIPRPDTETLVEAALSRVPPATRCAVLDLGTGSGAIALALALQRPQSQVTASDISPDALRIAQANAHRLGVPNVAWHLGDWFEGLGGRFDLIVSNPPYIPARDPHLDRGDLRFEPPHALVSGPDGLEAIRRIIGQAHRHLGAGGSLMLEHGFDQAQRVRDLLAAHGFEDVCTFPDLAGIERVSAGRWQPAGAPTAAPTVP
ncbi:MAG: peptide chain release factor N(5)-glutamine methyltransferase [Betaproteobacteria bacterium]|nr:peptide chain release factor N(5)-glutamine methyltransferase [Betaproteobacteria bacterium]